MTVKYLAAIITLGSLVLTWPAPTRAGGVYNLRLVSDQRPDFTDIDSMVQSMTRRWSRPEDKCIAIWRWARRCRRQVSNATEDGRLIWDPVLAYNSYGAMNCGVVSGLNIACWRRLGYLGRYVQLGDHTVSEVSWDHGKSWHLFDSSMSFFCYNHAGEVASCEEIKQSHACVLSAGKSEAGHYYLYHGAPQCTTHRGPDAWRIGADNPVEFQRTLINGAASYTDGFSPADLRYSQHARMGRRYVLNLLPGQVYTRYWQALDRGGADLPADAELRYYRPVNGRDPDIGLKNLRGSGLWLFEPDLTSQAAAEGFYDSKNVVARSGVFPQAAGQPAHVIFKVSAANVITSMRIEARGRCDRPGDLVRFSVSRNAGITWQEVWRADATGQQSMNLPLTEAVAGVTECLLRFDMQGSSGDRAPGVEWLRISTVTQVNRRTLPGLGLGTTQISISAGPQEETTVLWPSLHAGKYKDTVHAEHGLFSAEKTDGGYKATLGAGWNGEACHATWQVQVPTDIRRVTFGVVVTNRSPNSRVSLRKAFGSGEFSEFARQDDGAGPFDLQVLETFDAEQIPEGSRTASIQCAFFNHSNAATYNMAGIQDLVIQIGHRPRAPGFRPFEVTYHWTEHHESGDIARAHTQRVSELPQTYEIHTAGFRPPTMNRVSLRLADHAEGTQGYSDGVDVGHREDVKKVSYRWGENLAAGRPYTSSRPSSAASGNPDANGVELTNGVIIPPTDYTTSTAVQSATAFWDAGAPVRFVVDCGQPARIRGARIWSHQPNELFCHPARVELAISSDGKTWKPVGSVTHQNLWNPPGDYEPWEHDDDPAFDQLPAGGRLGYGYPLVFATPASGRYLRFLFYPLAGRGLGISELQVFDQVEVLAWPE